MFGADSGSFRQLGLNLRDTHTAADAGAGKTRATAAADSGAEHKEPLASLSNQNPVLYFLTPDVRSH